MAYGMKSATICLKILSQTACFAFKILISSRLRIFFLEVSYKLISAGSSQHQLSRGLILNFPSCTDREERGVNLIKS